MRAKPLRVRGGSGMGDALYVRPIAEHLVRGGAEVVVCSNYPEVFVDAGVRVEAFSRQRIDVLAHYSLHKSRAGTNQWQDVCSCARISIPFATRWETKNPYLLQRVRDKAEGRPVILLHGGRTPMGRTDGFGAELLPRREAFEEVLRSLADCFVVRIGKRSDERYPLPCSLDLVDCTSIPDLLDLGMGCDGVLAQCSFAVPLAEIFSKPLLAVWSHVGMSNAAVNYVRLITPRKVLSKPTSRFLLDSWSPAQMKEEVRAFCIASRSSTESPRTAGSAGR